MRILFDQGTPVPLRRALVGHTVSTAFEMGWGNLDNGALLKAAEAEFDVLVTTDRNSPSSAKSRAPAARRPGPTYYTLVEN